MNSNNHELLRRFEEDFRKKRIYQALAVASTLSNGLTRNPEFTRKRAICYLMIAALKDALEDLSRSIKSTQKSEKFSYKEIQALQCFWAKIKLIQFFNYQNSEKYSNINDLVLKPSKKEDMTLFLTFYYQQNDEDKLFISYINKLFDGDVDKFIKDMSFIYEGRLYFLTSVANEPYLSLKLFLIAIYFQKTLDHEQALEILQSINASLLKKSLFKNEVQKAIENSLIPIRQNLNKNYWRKVIN